MYIYVCVCVWVLQEIKLNNELYNIYINENIMEIPYKP